MKDYLHRRLQSLLSEPAPEEASGQEHSSGEREDVSASRAPRSAKASQQEIFACRKFLEEGLCVVPGALDKGQVVACLRECLQAANTIRQRKDILENPAARKALGIPDGSTNLHLDFYMRERNKDRWDAVAKRK